MAVEPMATNNRDYWAERALTRENEAYLRGANLSGKMFREYEAAAKSIRRQIDSFYSKYAGKYGLTYDQAVRLLNRKEFQEWKAALGDYVATIEATTDPSVKAVLKAQLDALSANSSISRLEALQGQIDLILNDLWKRGVEQMKEELGEGFVEGYYKKSYDLQSRAGFYNEIAKIDASAVEDAVSYPWSGAMFSDRLWQSKQALIFNTREIITQGLIQGKSVGVMASALSSRMGQSYKNAERLIRTETAHIHAEADRKAYKEAGVAEYEYMAAVNERTCDTCGGLDGRRFKVSDAEPGVNYPPIHPNCRCTTVEYDPEESLDWLNSGEPISNLFTELRPVCGFCEGDSVVLCGMTYAGTEEAVVLRDYGFDFTGDAAVVENIRNRRCINGIAKKLPAEPAQQGRKPASHSARRGQNDRLHPVDDRQPEAFSEEDQIFRDE